MYLFSEFVGFCFVSTLDSWRCRRPSVFTTQHNQSRFYYYQIICSWGFCPEYEMDKIYFCPIFRLLPISTVSTNRISINFSDFFSNLLSRRCWKNSSSGIYVVRLECDILWCRTPTVGDFNKCFETISSPYNTISRGLYVWCGSNISTHTHIRMKIHDQLGNSCFIEPCGQNGKNAFLTP